MRAVILIITIALLLATKCEQAKAAYYAEGVFDDPNLIHPPEDDKKPVPIPEEKIVLPIIPPGPQPEPVVPDVKPDVPPKPPVEPVIVPDLRAGELFVVATPSQYLVYDSPRGIVSIKRLKGPRDFFARFADSANRDTEEERAYTQPFIYVIKAEKRGTVELIISPQGADDESQAIRHTLVVMGRGPQPPPEPDVDPVDPPTPGPITSFRVIFVKESGATLSPGQTAIPGAKVIRDYLTNKTTPEGGLAGWREYDPQQITGSEQPMMKALWEKAKPQLIPAPCIVIEVNGKFTVLPFPADVNATMAKLKEYGGA